MADYSKMTDEDFAETLVKILDEMPASEIIAIGNVYSDFAEELNNDVLDRWAEDNPELAYPDDDE